MDRFLSISRWVARLSGLVIAGAFFVLMTGEMSTSDAGPSTLLEWTGIILMVTACASMLIAWRWEVAGAALSLGSLALIVAIIRGNHDFHTAILVMAIPGILHLLHWFAQHEHPAARHA